MKITFRWTHLLGGVPFLGVMYCHRCRSTPSELSIGLIFFEISFWFTKKPFQEKWDGFHDF